MGNMKTHNDYILVKMPKELKDKLRKKAEKERLSLSAYVRQLISKNL